MWDKNPVDESGDDDDGADDEYIGWSASLLEADNGDIDEVDDFTSDITVVVAADAISGVKVWGEYVLFPKKEDDGDDNDVNAVA